MKNWIYKVKDFYTDFPILVKRINRIEFYDKYHPESITPTIRDTDTGGYELNGHNYIDGQKVLGLIWIHDNIELVEQFDLIENRDKNIDKLLE